MDGKRKEIILVMIGLMLCVLLFIGVFKFGNLFAFLLVFPWLVGQLVNAGFNVWLARFITVPIASFMVIGFGLAFSLSTVKRNAGLAIFAIGLMLWSLIMFQMSKDYVFDPVSGKAQKCYTITPRGYEAVSCAWKVHPIYGSPVFSATKEMATAEWVSKHGLPVVQRIEPSSNLSFFSQDGSPLVWYYQYPDGKFDLFLQPGMHPQLNVALKPVDRATVEKILEYVKKCVEEAKMAAANDVNAVDKKANLVGNGNFSRALEGWKKQINDISKGYSHAEVVPFDHSASGKALHIVHKGEGDIQYSQIVLVENTDLIFGVSFQPVTKEGNISGFSGSGVAQIGLVYLDKEGHRLGETILVSYVKNPFADTALFGVPRLESDSNKKHFIEMAGNKYYQNYQIDIRAEIESHLMAVNTAEVSKIAIIIWCGASSSESISELWVADISLTTKKI